MQGRTLSRSLPRRAVLVRLVRAWAGTYDVQLAEQDVAELAELVDLEPAQDLHNPGRARAIPIDYLWAVADVLLRELGGRLCRVSVHDAELPEFEQLPVAGLASLTVKH